MLKTLLILCVYVPSFAQSQISLYARVGGSVPFDIAASPSFSSPYYWQAGFHGDLGVHYCVAEWLAIGGGIEHDWYPFSRYFQPTPSEYGGVLTSSGSPAQLTRIGLSVTIATRSNGRTPDLFVETAVGYALERYGRIDVTWGTISDGVILPNSYSPPALDYWNVWTRAGIRFLLSNELAIEPAISFRVRLGEWSIARRSTYGCVLLSAVYIVSV
jgi:hypothetical protein